MSRLSAYHRALGALLISSLLFALMGVGAKWASLPGSGHPSLAGGEIAFFRFLFGVVALLALSSLRPIELWGYDRRGLILRGLYGGVASTLFVIGIQLTTLTHAMLLNYTLVIWAPLIAIFALREPLTRRGLLAVAAAFAGIYLVVAPRFHGVHWGDLVALLSGVFAGAAIVQIRRLRQAESSYAVFFYFNLFGLPIALLAMALTRTPFILPALPQVPALLLVGATSFGGQLLMTYSYRAMTAAQGSLLSLTSILYSTLFGWLFFREALTWRTLLGGALILFGAWQIARKSTAAPVPETSAE